MARWLRGAVGVVAVALGAVVVSRPTTSLGVLALLLGAGLVVSAVVELMSDEPARWRVTRALVWLGAGVLILVSRGLTVRVVAVVVGVGLIVGGVLRALGGLRRGVTVDARVAALMLGVAEVVFGVLALAWPDITLLVVAVVFGARLIIAGAVASWQAVRGTETPASTNPPRAWRRWTRTIVAVVVLALAIGAAGVSAALHRASPVVDDFYAAPRDVPDEPGRLIRAEPFTRDVPPGALAWRILYTTTRGDGRAEVASGIVVVPEGDGPWPVLDWAHGTTGFAQNCAPSLAPRPFESGAMFVLDQVVDEGWALVAPDYIGLGAQAPHPYLVGLDSAHAVLDAARAARDLPEARLGDRHVVWGHSQGGGVALWTAAEAGTYAPELDLAGVAALAPAANLPGLVGDLPQVSGGSVFAAFVAAAYTATYDDVRYRDYVRPGAEGIFRQMATRCLTEPGVLVSILSALALERDPDVFSTDPTTGAFGRRLAQNVPPATGTAPLLLAQGGSDGLVTAESQDEYVDGLCAAGRQVDYRVYAGLDHVALVEPGSPLVPDLIAWTADRFSGSPPPTGCARSGG